MTRLEDCLNLVDFEKAARDALPSPVFHYIDGGADDEVTKRANTTAFDHYRLIPRYLQPESVFSSARTRSASSSA
ncbi:hypothetical protein MASR2M16_08460 [Thauera terpenica]